jgi:hypothetical protein
MRCLLFIIFLLPGVICAQQDAEVQVSPPPQKDSLRSTYIKSFPDHFFVWPVIKQRKLDFEITDLKGDDYTLGYKSNKPFSFGIGMYLFELGFELAFAVPLDEQSKKIYGESDARDIQLNVLGKKWGIDTYYQRYDGFYIEDPDMKVPANTPYPQRPDIQTRNIGFTVNYIFNSNKFSFRSAYNFAERQLRSAGSFVLFGSLNSFKVEGDSALVGPDYEPIYGKGAAIFRAKTTVLGVAPGYAYNLIYRGFFLNGTLALGPAQNWISYGMEDGPERHHSRLSGFVALRIAIGFNGDRVFGGLTFTNEGRSAKFENLEVTSTNSAFKMLIGYRFRETGFLKKRVMDIPKSLFN